MISMKFYDFYETLWFLWNFMIFMKIYETLSNVLGMFANFALDSLFAICFINVIDFSHFVLLTKSFPTLMTENKKKNKKKNNNAKYS